VIRVISGEWVIWHFMDALSVWGKEFASALGTLTPAIGWIPRLSWTGAFEQWQQDIDLEDPPLTMKSFPLQRGYRRWPVGWVSRTASRQAARLNAASEGFSSAVLALTSPYYAPVAERWRGPVVYYVTDLLIKYGGFREAEIRQLDTVMCRAASLVCPNSARIASYLIEAAQCSPDKIVIVPNATRQANLLPHAPCATATLPDDIADLPRPVAGVIGNLAANMDWELLERVVRAVPWLSWAFIGPTENPAGGRGQERARSELINMGGRVRFTGPRPYGALAAYARAFDVAVLPYCKREPTYSGSSTRFYEHLAACRPIIATRGFAELLKKEPLLRLVSDAEQMIGHLGHLRRAGFQDGCETLRWKTSLGETWDARAALMLTSLADALGGKPRTPAELAVKIR
jgi:hypothetical protein